MHFIQEDPCQGEGLTRCSEPGSKLFPYRVRFPVAPPLSGEIRARDRYHAKKLLQNRHPEASIHVLTVKERGSK
jgi:hypothetical protein